MAKAKGTSGRKTGGGATTTAAKAPAEAAKAPAEAATKPAAKRKKAPPKAKAAPEAAASPASDDAAPKNRRKHPRAALPLLVQVRVESVAQFKGEHAANISAGGLFLKSDELRPVGAVVYFQFMLKDGGPLIEGMGRVVHVVEGGGERPRGMGIEFVSVLEPSRSIIDALVEERLARGHAA